MFRASGNGGVCLASGNGIAVTSCTATTNAYGIASSLSFTAIATAGNYNVAVTTTRHFREARSVSLRTNLMISGVPSANR